MVPSSAPCTDASSAPLAAASALTAALAAGTLPVSAASIELDGCSSCSGCGGCGGCGGAAAVGTATTATAAAVIAAAVALAAGAAAGAAALPAATFVLLDGDDEARADAHSELKLNRGSDEAAAPVGPGVPEAGAALVALVAAAVEVPGTATALLRAL